MRISSRRNARGSGTARKTLVLRRFSVRITTTPSPRSRLSRVRASASDTFDRQRAGEIISRIEGWGAAYYPDQMELYARKGIHRLYTGEFSATTVPIFARTMSPVFVDIVVNSNDNGFAVLVVDQYGACAQAAIGFTFSEKP